MQEREAVAELADVIADLARLIRARAHPVIELFVMNETERMVMRAVDLHPGVAPSSLATITALQRSNLSTALRTLEAKGALTRSRRGRTSAVYPTPMAKQNLELLRSTRAAALIDPGSSSGLSLAELTQAIEILRRLEQELLARTIAPTGPDRALITSSDAARPAEEGSS